VEHERSMTKARFERFPGLQVRRRSRGAALAEHGILVGLVALVSIGTVSILGQKVSQSFSGTGTVIASAQAESAAETGGGSGSPSGSTEPPPEPKDVIVQQDSFDQGTPLQVAPNRRLVFLDTASFGYTSSNNSAYHTNSASSDTSGLAFLPIGAGTIQKPGPYLVDILAGNFNNKPFVTDVEVGLRSGEAFMTRLTSNTPEPALGATEVWSMTYQITQEQIDAGIDFAINVVFNGANRNASFDDLSIVYNPK